jgi:hypothetical protein
MLLILITFMSLPALAECRTEPGPGCYYAGGQCLYRVVCEPDRYGSVQGIDPAAIARSGGDIARAAQPDWRLLYPQSYGYPR